MGGYRTAPKWFHERTVALIPIDLMDFYWHRQTAFMLTEAAGYPVALLLLFKNYVHST